MKKNINPITFIFLLIVCFLGLFFKQNIINKTYSNSDIYLNDVIIKNYVSNFSNSEIKIENIENNGREYLRLLSIDGKTYKFKQYGYSGWTEYFGKDDVYYYGIADYNNCLLFSGENEDALIREFNIYKNYCERMQ